MQAGRWGRVLPATLLNAGYRGGEWAEQVTLELTGDPGCQRHPPEPGPSDNGGVTADLLSTSVWISESRDGDALSQKA